MHEGGIATPLIAHWPRGIVNPGRRTGQVGHVIDLMATCLDLGGIEYPSMHNGKKTTRLEGRSLAPILEGKTRTGHDVVFWEHEGNRAVRQGKWKLVSRFRGQWELYDISVDPSEIHNLAEALPERVTSMAKAYSQYAEKNSLVPVPEGYNPLTQVLKNSKRGAQH